MKRIITYIGIGTITLIALLLLAGCFWSPGEGTGSITMDLGSLRDAKTIDPAADTVRIYMQQESSGSYFAFEGTSLYIQEAIPAAADGSRTLTIEGIPAGNWLLIVAAGKAVEDTGGFYPLNYGVETTNIAADTDNPLTMTLSTEPPFEIATELVGKEITGAVEFNGNVYTFDAENEKLYFGPDESNMTEVSGFSTALSGYTVYSIDKGYTAVGADAVWINTDKGIVSYSIGGFEPNFQTTEFPVKESGGHHDGTNLYVYYRLPNGFGGADYDSITPADTIWYKYDDFDEYFTGNFVRQFFVYEAPPETFAYFATSLGAFRIESDKLNEMVEDFVVNAVFFEASFDNEFAAVHGLAFKAPDKMVLATENGIGVGTLSSTTDVVTDLQRIAGTAGITFTRVAVSDNGTYLVALDKNAKLYVFKDLGSSFEMKEFPFYTGFPGGVSQMTFLPAPSSSILYISGEGQDFASGGFAKINVETQIEWEN